MRSGMKLLLTFASIAATLFQPAAQAAFFGYPKALGPQLERIKFDAPALAPMAHTRFCLQYPEDCKAPRMVFRSGGVKLTPSRWSDLVRVNAEVNRSIKPERNDAGLAGERWLVSPKSGDCNDYAVTKRHELLARGWPAHALLLAEVVTSWGEHHLVLVVRMHNGEFVADNLNANIRPWFKTGYQWVRIQSPRNPKYWSKMAQASA
jgi:predicted transglutaminase-like cysteine proteinase